MSARFFCFVGSIALLASPAGDAQSTNAVLLHTDLPSVGVSAIRAFAALILLLAAFIAGVWLLRKGQPIAWRKSGPPKLAILETRPLGNRFALYVVGYEQQRLLMGSSPAGLTLLSQLPPATDARGETPAPAEDTSFVQCLQHILKRK